MGHTQAFGCGGKTQAAGSGFKHAQTVKGGQTSHGFMM
jgi:hypothetical protein